MTLKLFVQAAMFAPIALLMVSSSLAQDSAAPMTFQGRYLVSISDADMLEQCLNMIEKYDLERQWYTDARVICSSKELFELYHAYINNTHTGEKAIYKSPLFKRQQSV